MIRVYAFLFSLLLGASGIYMLRAEVVEPATAGTKVRNAAIGAVAGAGLGVGASVVIGGVGLTLCGTGIGAIVGIPILLLGSTATGAMVGAATGASAIPPKLVAAFQPWQIVAVAVAACGMLVWSLSSADNQATQR